MQDYRKLYVWKKAHQLALDVFADSAAHFTTPQTLGDQDAGPQGSYLNSFEHR